MEKTEVPAQVIAAKRQLLELGFTNHLISEARPLSGSAILSDEVLHLAEVLWNYHHLEGPIDKSDCIVGLGSYDLRVAERCADLYVEQWAPLIVFFRLPRELDQADVGPKRGGDICGTRDCERRSGG
jgi:hypothetical protein